MIRLLARLVLALGLIAVGWVAAKAQSSAPDFEIIVNAPVGQTTIECKRGCNLAWVERGINPNSTPVPTFEFGCSGGGVVRCSSAAVGGWITR
jgi:hypothetical protein